MGKDTSKSARTFSVGSNRVGEEPAGTGEPGCVAGSPAGAVPSLSAAPGAGSALLPGGAGALRVIRGSSWRNAAVTELRVAYRDYGDGKRNDLGFRIARYAQ